MIIDDGTTKKVCCDRCSKELTDKVVVLDAGDVLCEDCFDASHREMTVDEYLNGD